MASAGLLAATTLTACQPAGGAADAATPVVVFAAASLEVPFAELIDEYQEEHPDAEFAPLEVAGSQHLVQQVNEGANADVLALADETSLEQLVSPPAADSVAVFATNTLAVVVPSGNPAQIHSLSDLADPSHQVVVCAVNVPCGAATKRLLAHAEVDFAPVSEENSVRAVLSKVELGEADAGIVYLSDAHTSGQVEYFQPPEATAIVNRYPIAVFTDNPHAAGFADFVSGERGREVLENAGFVVPRGE